MTDTLTEFESMHSPHSGRTLVVGSRIYKARPDRRLRYKDVLGVDMEKGPGVDRVLDLEGDLPADLGRFQHIDCISVLEHSRRPWKIARNLERLLVKLGTLFVTVPFVWRIHGYPDDYFRFTPRGVRALFPGIQWARVCFAHTELSDEDRIPQTIIDGHIHFARTEVYAFGNLL